MPVELMFDSTQETLKNEGPLSRASWKANRIAEREQILASSSNSNSLFPVHTVFFGQTCPTHMIHTHTRQEGILTQGSQITLGASQLPTSSAGWTLQDTFSLESFQASKADFTGEQRQGSYPLVFAVAG